MLVDPVPVRLAGIGDEAAVELTGQIDALRVLGWSAIELRTVDGTNLAELAPRNLARVRDALREAGIDVVCLASRIGGWARPITAPLVNDLRELDILAEHCAVFGTRLVRVMSYPNDGLPEHEWGVRARERLAQLAERAARHGIVLAHENCSGWAGTDPERMSRLVTDLNSPSLRCSSTPATALSTATTPMRCCEPSCRTSRTCTSRTRSANPAMRPTCCPVTAPHASPTACGCCWGRVFGNASLEPHLATQPHKGIPASESAARWFLEAGERVELLVEEAHRWVTGAATTGLQQS